MNEVNMDQLLVQMRTMADRASNIQESAQANNTNPDFTNLFKDAVGKVNEAQQASSELKRQFEMGNPNIELTDVMIASEKSSISFQAMTQVRNRLVTAYQEIMNMQV